MSILKKISLTAVACTVFATGQTMAAIPGAYFGVQLGWGQVHNAGISQSDANQLLNDTLGVGNYVVNSFSSDATANGVAGRVFAGYQVTCNWALELGWAKFTNAPVHANLTATQITPFTTPSTVIAPGSIATDAFDLNVKGIIPLPYHFNVYGKLGYAYLEARSQETLTTNALGVINSSQYKDIKHRYYPEFGVGAAYDLRPDFTMDLSYTRIQKTGGDTQLGSTDMVALGVIWDFGAI